MRISAKGTYGLRAVFDLALNHDQGNVQSADIAARQSIPEAYLVQLLNMLRKSGLVRSVRGPKGGHSLARHPDDTTVGDALAALEGPVDLLGEGDDAGREEACQEVIQEVWREVEAAIEGVLTSTTFGDLCRRHQMRQKRIVYRI